MPISLVVKKDGAFKTVSSDDFENYRNDGWQQSSFIEMKKAQGTYNDSLKKRNETLSQIANSSNATKGTNTNIQPFGSKPSLYPSVRDNTTDINEMFQEQKRSLLSELRQKIAQAKSGHQQIIANAPKQFQPLKNQSELSRVRSLDTLREVIANRGDRGGIGRSELLATDAAFSKQLNDINLQQQNVIDEANTAIANLEAEGRFEEAQIVSNNAMNRLRAIIEENNRIDAANEDARRFGINTKLAEAGLTGNYEGTRTMGGTAQDITNQINRLKLENLPTIQRLEVERLEQDVLNGAITFEQAQYQLNQLKDPNSVYNRQNALELRRLEQDVEIGDINLQGSRDRQELIASGVDPDTINSENVTEQDIKDIFNEALTNYDLAGAAQFLTSNAEYIMKTFKNGTKLYNELKKQIDDMQSARTSFY